jgi:Leucine-rich repeat (LRR) protein
MLTYAPRLVIQGQPGSGKSTMLRWLAIQLAQRTLSQGQPALASWDDCIPFYIQLRTFANRTLPTPSEWPTLQVRQLALKPPDTWMHEVLSDGRAVVLIDGVDETPQGQRAELLQWLQEVMNAYPWARYIITSRPAAIKLWPEWIDWSRSSGFLTLSLQEMELEQCFGFIKQWHDALQQSLPDTTQREEVAALVEPLKQLVRQRDTLRRLARNPLLCSMICALHREHPQTIPQNRIKLYQDCVDMLMHRRDAERKVGSLADYPPLSNIHEEVVLSNYAYHLMRNGASEETIDEADDYFDQLIQKMNMPGWSAKRLRHYFVARTGLLIEPSEERIAFAHLTFQEFLAAQKIVEENDIGMLIDKAGEDKWRETILLTIGTKGIRQAQSDRLLNGLLNKANDTTIPGHRHEIYLLAVACLETAIYLTPPMRRLILNKAATLIPPRDVDAINLIAKGGDPIVELLRFNSRYSFTKMALCVAALIAIGSEQALKAIVEYATSPVYKDEGAEPLRQAVTRGLFTFDPTYYCQQVLCYISTLDLSKAQSILSVLPHLQGLTNLQSLDLSGNELNEDELLYLQNFTSLQSLKLEFNQVTDIDILYLQNLNNLQILDLSSNQVSDAGLPHLQSLTELQSLNLSYNEISDGGLSYLRGWIRLQSLNLSCTQISDIGLVNLLELRELQSLKLSRTEVSSAGLLHLKNLAKLQSLDLSSTRITNEGLLHLKNLTNLKSLNLSGTRISSVGLLHLQSLTALQSLDLSNTQISNAGLLNLQNLNNLQSLNINHTQINDSGLLHLQKLMSLQSLDLDSTQVSDAGLQHLKSLVGLLSLDLNNTRIGNAGLLCLQSLTNLQSLDLGRTRISDAGLQHLKGLSGLRSLNLSGTQVSDIGLLHLRDLASLQSLDLNSTQISNAGLRHLKNLSKLQFLLIPYTKVQDVSALDHLPELNIEWEVPF